MFIKANKIGVFKENSILIVGFLDKDGNSYFQIQDSLGLEYDEQDIRLGMNTYYLEKNDQRFSCYGGLSKIILNSNQLIFYLDAIGVSNIEESKIEIELNLNQTEYFKLKNELLFLIDKHSILSNLKKN